MSKKSYEIAFRLGARMDSSLRTAFANANKSMNQLNKNSGSLARSSGTLTRTMGSLRTSVGGIVPAFGNMVKNVSGGVMSGLIAPFRSAIGMVKQYAGALGLLSGGALASSGMARLSAIENARTSLTVMMGDAERANKFMDDVLAFAKTTPFSFPDLAETSRNLIAFGMDEAKVVPTLKAIGDAAAASGKGAEGLNQVASAFGDMQIAGYLGMDQINRLQAGGVPALKILANQFGISTDEMKKKISSGSVESVKAIDMLVEGMQEGTKGIAGETAAMAGIMEEMKSTWVGSVDTLKSSISSTMATIMEPAKPHIQNAMAWFGSTFSKLPPIVFGIVDKVKPIFQTIAPIVQNVGTAIKGIFKSFQGGEHNIAGTNVFVKMGLTPETAGKVVAVIKGFKNVIQSVFSSVYSIVISVTNVFKGLSGGIKDTFLLVAPHAKQGLGAIIGVIKSVLGQISTFYMENGQQIIQAIKNVAKVIMAIFKVIAPVILFIIKTVWDNVKGVIQGALNIILGTVKFFISLFTGDWAGLWTGVKQMFGGAIEFLWNLWNLMIMGRLVKGVAMVAKSIWGFLKGLGPRIATSVQYYYHLFMDKFYQIGIGILRTIMNSVGKIVGVARNAVTNFITVFQTVKTFGVNIFMSIVSAVRNLFSNIFGFISNVVSTVVSGVIARVSGFVGSIQGFMMNLWTNITTIFAQIRTAMASPFEFLSTLVQTVVSSVSGLVSGLFNGVTAAGRGAINALVVAANGMISGINKLQFTVPDWVPGLAGKTIGFNLPQIPMLAKGGVTTGPTLAMIGEGAEQEAVLPLSKLQALLNMPKNDKGSGDQYVYRPTYILQGNASKEDVERADNTNRKEFDRWIERRESDEDRLSFS